MNSLLLELLSQFSVCLLLSLIVYRFILGFLGCLLSCPCNLQRSFFIPFEEIFVEATHAASLPLPHFLFCLPLGLFLLHPSYLFLLRLVSTCDLLLCSP